MNCKFCGAKLEGLQCPACGGPNPKPDWEKRGEPFMYKGHLIAVTRNSQMRTMEYTFFNGCSSETLRLTDEFLHELTGGDERVDVISLIVDAYVGEAW